MTDRFSRQRLLPWIGDAGQARIAGARVGIVGLGALGCVSSAFLARAGVGALVLLDRDFVEVSNLTRQILYTEEDCERRLPKAVAARNHLLEARRDLEVEAHSADLDPELALDLFARCDLVVDGTDNFETRYLLNDAAVKSGKPWVYGGAVSSYGSVLVVEPGKRGCLRCCFPAPPPAGSSPTCDTAGVIGPAVGAVGSFQAGEALKLLAGRPDLVAGGLLTVDLQTWSFSRVEVPRDPACPCCGAGRFDFLEERGVSRTHRVCGRDGILVLAPKGTRLDLAAVKARLAAAGPVFENPYLIQTEWEGHPVTLYPDGRALIQKTDDPTRARALYARYLGI